MGTRAQFFVGNPMDLEGRQWLGTVAWDGYPDGDCGDALTGAVSEDDFRARVAKLAATRDDFCDPATNSFPFPWTDDLFLTDCTYAWFDGATQFTWFHRGFQPLAAFLAREEEEEEEESGDTIPNNIPAPITSGAPGPDSIMIIRAL